MRRVNTKGQKCNTWHRLCSEKFVSEPKSKCYSTWFIPTKVKGGFLESKQTGMWVNLTLGVQESCHPQLFSYPKRMLQIWSVGLRRHPAHVDHVRPAVQKKKHQSSRNNKATQRIQLSVCGVKIPVFMNDGVKQPSVPPGGREVVTSYSDVALCYLLGPEQQPLLGCHVLGLSRHMDLRDLTQVEQHDLKQNKRGDQTSKI